MTHTKNPAREKHTIETEISVEQQKLQALQAAESASLERLIALKNELLEARGVKHG